MTKFQNKEKIIQYKFLNWYKKNRRSLPWRESKISKLPDPYHVFVSEFMLQQTTVRTVENRFIEFIQKWPNIKILSKKKENQILNFWSGLGYYSRARNLLKSSKIISKKFSNKIPDRYEDLIKLPGVGDYTAKAILSIAFNKPYIPVEANVERIIARIYGKSKPLSTINAEINFLANKFISKKYSNRLAQAFMDYGSTICLPRQPFCSKCIISKQCVAKKKKLTNLIPFKTLKKNKKQKFTRAYLIVSYQNEILVRKRPSIGMLASMLEIPNDQWVDNKKKLVHEDIFFRVKNKIQYKESIKYSFSHFDLRAEVYLAKVKKCNFNSCKWIKINSIKRSGMPTVMKRIIQSVF